MTCISNNYKHKIVLALLLMTCSNLSLGANISNGIITDIDINTLIAEAIQTHPLVGSARAEQAATVEGITAAKLNLLPAPAVSAGYDKDNDFVTELTVRQSLWTGGLLTANVNQAIFDDKAAVENIYEQQNQVAKTTIEAWQTYITAVAMQRVHLDNLKQLNEFEAMMQRRVEQGVSARIELDLVTNRILQEQNAYDAAAEQQRIAVARLEQITGHPISQGSAYTVPELRVLVEQAKRQSLDFERMAFSNASFYNPSVVKQYFQVESAKQEVKARRASRFPTVYAQYNHAYHKDSANNDGGKFSIGLDYQPGAGFSNLALTRASTARVDSLIQNQEAARRNVMESIQVQFQQFASAKNRELSLVAAVAGAQIVVNSYRRQFIAGRKTWLEVLNAVRELGDYQIQLVQTRSDILAAFYKLQVDFSLMPWQTFAHNRDPVKMFRALDPVEEWLLQQKTSLNNRYSSNFGYDSAVADVAIDSNFAPVSIAPVGSASVDSALLGQGAPVDYAVADVETTAIEVSKSDLSDSDLSDSDLPDSDLSDAEVTDTPLSNSDMPAQDMPDSLQQTASMANVSNIVNVTKADASKIASQTTQASQPPAVQLADLNSPDIEIPAVQPSDSQAPAVQPADMQNLAPQSAPLPQNPTTETTEKQLTQAVQFDTPQGMAQAALSSAIATKAKGTIRTGAVLRLDEKQYIQAVYKMQP